MTMRCTVRLLTAALLGLAAALLVSCGGSGKGLIPEANAGPLRGDFEAVAKAAESGNGSCAGTERALGKTEKDFLALPSNVDSSLRDRLRTGIANLHRRALAMCAELTSTTSTATTPTAPTTTETTPPTTSTTPQGTSTTPATPPADEGGGTSAPGEEPEGHGEGKGKGKGADKGAGKGGEEGGEAESGGASAGGSGPGGGR